MYTYILLSHYGIPTSQICKLFLCFSSNAPTLGLTFLFLLFPLQGGVVQLPRAPAGRGGHPQGVRAQRQGLLGQQGGRYVTQALY